MASFQRFMNALFPHRRRQVELLEEIDKKLARLLRLIDLKC